MPSGQAQPAQQLLGWPLILPRLPAKAQGEQIPPALSPAEEMRVFSKGWHEMNEGLSHSCQQKGGNGIREGIYQSRLFHYGC